MVSLCWRDCFITVLLITSSIQAIPIASSSTPNETAADHDDIEVNFHRLAQHVSNHLLFDHVDPLIYNLSQHIASIFRTSMTLERRFLHDYNDHSNRMMIQPAEKHVDHDVIPVDMDLLLGQLQGAVGSFLEDKLPGIWNRQLAGLDRTMMQAKFEYHLLSHCPDQRYLCMQHSTAGGGVNLLQQIVQLGDQTIQNDLTQAWLSILQNDLPYLFNAAKTQVNGVLTLFDPPEHQVYQLQWNIDWRDMQTLIMKHWTALTPKLLCHTSDHATRLHWIHYSEQP